MKTIRWMALLIAGSMAVSMNAVEYNTLQRMYQAAKDPQQRAAILQRMQDARVAAQQQIESGLATVRERLQDPALRAAALQKVENFKKWARENKGKIIAAATALTAVTAVATAAVLSKENRDSILKVFSNNGVDLSNDAVKRYCFVIGSTAQRGSDALITAVKNLDAQNREYFLAFTRNLPGFIESLAQLAGFQSAVVLKERLGIQ